MVHCTTVGTLVGPGSPFTIRYHQKINIELIGNSVKYVCATNYQKRERFDKDIAKNNMVQFFPHVILYSVRERSGIRSDAH